MPAAASLDRDSPLFCQSLLVGFREERAVRLTLRVLRGKRDASPGCGSHGQAHGGGGSGVGEELLHLEITDESDPYFLYTMQVGEEDYHALKRDQRLRVDFGSFPAHLVGLLERCMDGEATDATSVRSDGNFLVRLESGGSSSSESGARSSADVSTLSIVETNQFRELTHLSIRVRLGNDSAIKSYLAGRFSQAKSEANSLRSKLAATEHERSREASLRAEAQSEAARLRDGRERDLRDLRAAHSAELTALREEGLRRLEETASQHSKALHEAQLRDREERASLAQRASEAEARRTQLMETNFRLETEVQDLRTKHAAGEAALRELGRLRETVQLKESEAFETEKENQRLNLRVAALAQQVEDKQEVVDQTMALKAAAEASRGKLVETLEAYKANVMALQDKLEGSVKEINRGNSIIQRLQGDHKTLKHKLQLRTEVVRQQERVITELKEALNVARNQAATAAMEQRAAEGRADNLHRELNIAKEKLAESAQLIESNQQVITWLNRELNESQLMPQGHAATFGGSYTSKPTAANFSGASVMTPFKHNSSSMSTETPSTAQTTPSTSHGTPQSGGLAATITSVH